MAKYISHEEKHPAEGKWARSVTTLHRIEWRTTASFDHEDAVSSCDTYLAWPYYSTPIGAENVCERCLRVAIKRGELVR